MSSREDAERAVGLALSARGLAPPDLECRVRGQRVLFFDGWGPRCVLASVEVKGGKAQVHFPDLRLLMPPGDYALEPIPVSDTIELPPYCRFKFTRVT